MRVILDNIVGCAWYEVIPSLTYKNLTDEQASAALNLARPDSHAESVSALTFNSTLEKNGAITRLTKTGVLV